MKFKGNMNIKKYKINFNILTFGLIIVLLFLFLSWEIFINFIYPNAIPNNLKTIYLIRGISSSFLLTFFAIWYILESSRKYEKRLEQLNQELEHKSKSLEDALQKLEETQEGLIQAEKLASIGTLTAGIAHQINSPLGIISSRIECLMLEADEKNISSEIVKDLKVIKEYTDRVAQVVSGLLSFSRQTNFLLEWVNISKLLVDSIFLLKKQFAKEGVEIESKLAKNIPLVLASSNHLQQVFVSLLSNAKDAIVNKGTIKVNISVISGNNGSKKVVIDFEDNGCGIKKENMRKIFDPFFTTKEQGKGTGLGLWVAYGIIKDHGGEIKIESKINYGSKFSVILPTGVSK